MGRSQNIAYNDLVRPEEEDWHMLRDSAERRKIQNRLAQRAYRRNIKYRSLELEKLKQELSEIRQKTQGRMQRNSQLTLNTDRNRPEPAEEQDNFAQDDVPSQPNDPQNTLAVPPRWSTDLGPFWSQSPDRSDSRPRAVSASSASPTMADKNTIVNSPRPCSVTSDSINRQRVMTLSPGQNHHPSSSRPTRRRDVSSTWLQSSFRAMPGHQQTQYPHLSLPELDAAAQNHHALIPDPADSVPMELFPFAPDDGNFEISIDSCPHLPPRHDSAQPTPPRQHSPHLQQRQPASEPTPTQPTEPPPITLSWSPAADDHHPTAHTRASNRQQPFGQQSLLHLAAQNGHSDVLRMLLLRGGIDINCRDAAGFTPLQLAVAAGRAEMVQLLLDHGADARAPATFAPGWGWL